MSRSITTSVLLISVLTAMVFGFSHQAKAQSAQQIHLSVWRQSAEFSYIRQYFPSRPIVFDLKNQMTAKEVKSSTTSLQTALAERATVARARSAGIGVLLARTTALTPMPLPRALQVDFRDDGNTWFNNSPPGTVIVSPRTLRGLMRGSLQALKFDVPKQGSNWGVGSHLSFFGGDLLDDTKGELTDEEWDLRFSKLMTVMEKAKIRSMAGTAFALIADNDDAFDDFEFDDADDYISGHEKMSLFASIQLGGAMMEFSKHYIAAERFLLAHELGHLALRNNPTELMSCDQRQRAEDDADAFAIALLMMDDAVGSQIISTTNELHELSELFGDNEEMQSFFGLDSDGYAVAYGYGDFTDFVFKAAEFSGDLGASCKYRAPTDRRAFIDGLRRTFFDQRREAFEVINQYVKSHPPLLRIQTSGTLVKSSGAKMTDADIYSELGADERCPNVVQKRGKRGVAMKQSPVYGENSTVRGTEYYIRCKWPIPEASILNAQQMALIGPVAWLAFMKTYRS